MPETYPSWNAKHRIKLSWPFHISDKKPWKRLASVTISLWGPQY